MLSKLTRFASAEIEQLLNNLQADEDSYNAELRSLDREKLVFPVKLATLDREFSVHAFSRDVTSDGLGLITPQPFSEGEQMDIQMYLHSGEHTIRSECRWSRKFGESFWASGWQLNPDVTLDVTAIKELDTAVIYDARSTDRKKFAIPAVIHQKGQLPRVHGFTRNVSGDGANVVLNQKIKEGSFCMVEFIRGSGERCEVIAECVWTKKYGECHWMTGWQFPRLERVAKFHAASFGRE